jgi:hypothetical protein
MKSDRDDSRIISLASLLVGLIGLMVSLHLCGYVVVGILGGGIGAATTVALTSRWRR